MYQHRSLSFNLRGPFVALRWVAALLAFALLAAFANQATGDPGKDQILGQKRVVQEPGKVTYWVLPGPRELDEDVFGTPENPKMLLKPKLDAVRQGGYPPTVLDLLHQVPVLVSAPEKGRMVTPDERYVFAQPTPFSNKGSIIQGHFDATFTDRVKTDPPGKPAETPDSATMTAEFSDPQGNQYKVVLKHVVKPPLPGYQTQGGVMLDSVHHGNTGTGTPLMPKVRTIAALWGLGDLYINGELVDSHRMIHLMTSEVVRNRDYELVQSNDLPLDPSQRIIRDQAHHTHLMMPPVKGTPKGPVFSPVPTAFKLPNGKHQPFLHIMFEQDEVQDL